MAQCMYLDETGRRCWRTAEEESPFCRWHSEEVSPEPGRKGLNLPRLLFRLAALLLLAAFVIPLAIQGYRLIKALLD